MRSSTTTLERQLLSEHAQPGPSTAGAATAQAALRSIAVDGDQRFDEVTAAERQLRREGVALVRLERQADEAALKQLEAAYHTNANLFSEKMLRWGWRCTQCRYLNFESRLACAKCLAIAPHAAKRPGGASVAAKEDVKRVPHGTREAGIVLHHVKHGSRCYRIFSTTSTATVSNRTQRRASHSEGYENMGSIDDEDQCGFASRVLSSHRTSERALLPPSPPLPESPRGPSDGYRGSNAVDVASDAENSTRGALVVPEVHYNSVSSSYYAHVPLVGELERSSPPPALLAFAKKLAEETHCEIRSRQVSSGGDEKHKHVMTISGKSESGVQTAAQRLLQHYNLTPATAEGTETDAVAEARKKSAAKDKRGAAAEALSSGSPTATRGAYTHFISIPLAAQMIPSIAEPLGRLLDLVRYLCDLPMKDPALTVGSTAAPPLPGCSPRLGEVLRASASSCVDGGGTAAIHAVADDKAEMATSVPLARGLAKSAPVEEAMLQDPAHFHLTVLMLSLPTDELVARAVAQMPLVEKAIADVFPTAGYALHLKGLKITTHTPQEAQVLYVEVAEECAPEMRLFFRRVHEIFAKAGLVSEKEVQLGQLIHATLINTKWRKKGPTAGRDDTKSKAEKQHRQPLWHRQQSFDATRLLDLLGEVSLGSHSLRSVELSKLGAARDGAYYEAEAVAKFL